LTRPGLAAKLGISDETLGRYERGEWKRSPGPAILAHIARTTEVPDEWLAIGLLAPDDPVKRIADASKREAERQGEHPGQSPRDHLGEDDTGTGL
jgi:transcriptional regulator with XRE-family HTH domain